MPPPFDVTAPSAGATFSRTQQAVTVTWSGSGAPDPFTWQLKGDCLAYKLNQQAADTGTLTIPVDAIQPRTNQSGNTCMAELRLFRTRYGSVDRAYGKGGDIWARQLRTLYFLSTP